MNPQRRATLLGSIALVGAAQLPLSAQAEPVVSDAIDIEPVVGAALLAVEQSRVSGGRYRRFLGKQRRTRVKGDHPSTYGSAAAACILYTAARFPGGASERAAFTAFLRSGQDGRTGMFSDQYHGQTHATAYTLAALDLFDAAPAHPLHQLQRLHAPGAIEALLDSIGANPGAPRMTAPARSPRCSWRGKPVRNSSSATLPGSPPNRIRIPACGARASWQAPSGPMAPRRSMPWLRRFTTCSTMKPRAGPYLGRRR